MPDPPAVSPAPNPATTSVDTSSWRYRGPKRPPGETRSQSKGGRDFTEEDTEAHKEEGASRPRRPRNPRPREGKTGDFSTPNPDGPVPSADPSGNKRGGNGGTEGQSSLSQDQPGSGDRRRHRPPRHRGTPNAIPNATQLSEASTPAYSASDVVKATPGDGTAPQKRSRPRRKFNSELTQGGPKPRSATQNVSSAEKYKNATPKADDLTSRLIAELSTPPYPDCLICFAPMTPMQSTWSCSPSQPTLPASDDETGFPTGQAANMNGQCCWKTFHVKCIRTWATKNVKDVEDAWLARGEVRQGDWRCPGCQSKRTGIPSSYWCFCGSTPDPKPLRLAIPHSCGNPCSRSKECGHPCSLNCHPGPCPPCQVTISMPCYCSKETVSFRCSRRGLGARSVLPTAETTCGNTCGRMLSCGNHACQDTCHPGKCSPCTVRVEARCFCGKETRELACGEGEEKESRVLQNEKVEQWTGFFACEQACERLFDCGIHHCKKSCHPPSLTPPPCPRSPLVVTHCPCGKHSLSPNSAPFFPIGTVLTRVSCTNPVPTCDSTCMKPLEGCEHVCSANCHTGPCPPCSIVLVRPCRCGSSTAQVRCSEDQARARARARGDKDPETEILCERPCGALRACGRHQCNRICCPLASLSKGKGKKRADVDLVDPEGWHECDLVCGKTLGCGKHHCEARDHKGACPPCLRASFQEMVCHCGRTILEPPIPCGTMIACGYPCSRPPPQCGHPKTQHACHEEPTPCPPCPYLTSKQCACGKKLVDNVLCRQEKVSCGMPCGKLLSCGFHHCDRLCHGDACGPCRTPCGKPRKLCLPAQHPCTLPCHAPASCDESEPCRSVVTITCSCGRISQTVSCGRCLANPAREGGQQLKCTNECALAKRNARLAEALGINPDRGEGRAPQVNYNDELLTFAKANAKFCTLVEKSFSDFLSSDKKVQVLPHMPEQKRRFVHDLAAVYRMDTQMVDQEPHRSVQLFRRIDSRVPVSLLSAAASPGLGKLADYRAPAPGLQPLSRPGSSAGASARASPAPISQPAAGHPAGSRGWTSVVARPPQVANPVSKSWGTPLRLSPSPAPRRTTPVPPPAPAAQAEDPQEDVPEDWEDSD